MISYYFEEEQWIDPSDWPWVAVENGASVDRFQSEEALLATYPDAKKVSE